MNENIKPKNKTSDEIEYIDEAEEAREIIDAPATNPRQKFAWISI